MAGPGEELKSILQKHPAAPFLFAGSGFSRRYLGLGDWAALLQQFCKPIKDFGYYSSKANGELPLAASYMAQDYNEWWWSAPEMADNRAQFSSIVKGSADALKVEIANYLRQYSLEDARKSEFGGEIAALSKVAVDGVITTNWDFFLEELFPDYKVFSPPIDRRNLQNSRFGKRSRKPGPNCRGLHGVQRKKSVLGGQACNNIC
jgi:hypothetical protein